MFVFHPLTAPVHIYQMSVSGDLLVANDTKWKRQMTTKNNQGIGHGLQQYYTGRVTLNGSLTVNNVKRDTSATVLQLGEQSLSKEKLHSDYLLLQGEQVREKQSERCYYNAITYFLRICLNWCLAMQRSRLQC